MSPKQRIAIVILVIYLLAVPVGAVDDSGSITVIDTPDVRFHLYPIATLSGSRYYPAPDFRAFSIPDSSASAEHWRILTAELSEYVKKAEIPASQTVTTGKGGEAVFQDLPKGLYLLTADAFLSDGQLYIPSECIVQINGTDVVLYPKHTPAPEEKPNTSDAAALELCSLSLFISALALGILLNKKHLFTVGS